MKRKCPSCHNIAMSMTFKLLKHRFECPFCGETLILNPIHGVVGTFLSIIVTFFISIFAQFSSPFYFGVLLFALLILSKLLYSLKKIVP